MFDQVESSQAIIVDSIRYPTKNSLVSPTKHFTIEILRSSNDMQFSNVDRRIIKFGICEMFGRGFDIVRDEKIEHCLCKVLGKKVNLRTSTFQRSEYRFLELSRRALEL